MMTYNTILTSQAERVFSITLNRPTELNPLSREVLDELAAALEAVERQRSECDYYKSKR
jgi:enoyl-CoA hydratase/carnithine racemase